MTLRPLARAPLERYGALVINEFAGLDDLHITTVLGAGTVSSPPLTGEDILRCFGFRKGESGPRALSAPNLSAMKPSSLSRARPSLSSSGMLAADIAALVAMLGAGFGAIFLLLRFVVRDRR